jgi:hypothetical protein
MTIPNDLPLIRSERLPPANEPMFSNFTRGFDLEDRDSDVIACIRWCADRHGPSSMDGDWFFYASGLVGRAIWFRDFNHAMEFKLTWK